MEFPVLRLVANPAEVSGSPDPGRGSAQTIFPRGQPTAFTPLIYGLPSFYIFFWWFSRSKNDRIPSTFATETNCQ